MNNNKKLIINDHLYIINIFIDFITCLVHHGKQVFADWLAVYEEVKARQPKLMSYLSSIIPEHQT